MAQLRFAGMCTVFRLGRGATNTLLKKNFKSEKFMPKICKFRKYFFFWPVI